MVVNSVFALQIRLVDQYNGDVVNFAGDAMFVMYARRVSAPSLAGVRRRVGSGAER